MATVTIPFPTTETLLGPELARAASPPKINIKPTTKKPATKKHANQPKSLNGVAKPKQTKSRNGCATCKEKRLKCDETKPTCDQCKKRNVECGGYNKIFQWRPEEKATFRAGSSPKNRKRSTTAKEYSTPPTSPAIPEPPELAVDASFDASTPIQVHNFPLDPQLDQRGYDLASSQLDWAPENLTPRPYDLQHVPQEAESLGCILIDDEDEIYLDDEFDPGTTATARSGFSSRGSPPIEDMVLHSADVHTPRDWHGPLVQAYQQEDMLDREQFDASADGDVEEISRQEDLWRPYKISYPSPSPSESSSSSNGSSLHFVKYREPGFNPFSTEMLITRFAHLTCGILSIKDGQNENPWRTMLLPMSFGVPALHHAILSLSAFHASRENTSFRYHGLKHMQKSIKYLGSQLGTMRRDVALATTLVLAFSESWNEETSTGIRHLRAARALVTQAIASHKGDADFEEMDRLRFLRNTWVYMDVIARITALDCDDLENLDALFVPVYGPESQNEELDPLMGCASELFPLIGKVANLVREVRKNASNSPRIVSRAADLKDKIMRWRPPSHLQVPEDESIDISHSLSTAEAYRWATLLFLFQAVPMIATASPGVLAERILCNLVAVPLSSRVIIIHIFPLLVAGCELISDDNRMLVIERWESMTQRMTIGNLDRCSDVVHEVWKRRDEATGLVEDGDDQGMMREGDSDIIPPSSRRSSNVSPTPPRGSIVRPDQLHSHVSEAAFDIDQSITVRGYGHWLTVMQDWDWAVLLG